jgi:uracil phosphoribosyltransferase
MLPRFISSAVSTSGFLRPHAKTVGSLLLGAAAAYSFTATSSTAAAPSPSSPTTTSAGNAIAATPSSGSLPSNVTVLPGRAADVILTKMRDVSTNCADFARLADRLCSLLAEEGLAAVATTKKTVTTPCGRYTGPEMVPSSEISAVSIMRSGDLLLEPLRRLEPGIAIGKLLIQRDETKAHKPPIMFYTKLPKDISTKRAVLLVDPMLATAGSANMAIDELIKAGVKEERILFLNCISCPEGIAALNRAHPKVKMITAFVDEGMNEVKYIVPGLGDFGDRALGTMH